jgi:REP element-mobilizing transposase RayT
MYANPAQSEYRRKLPHLQRPDKALFVTFVTKRRLVLPPAVRHHVLAHCLHDHGVKLYMHAAVVMPDHVHLVFTPLRDVDGHHYGLAEIMKPIKGASARTVNRMLARSGALWQPESYDHVVREQEGVRRTAEYICKNPVRGGLVANEDDYRWLWREWVEGAPGAS